MAYPGSEFADVLGFLGSRKVDMAPLITHRFALDEFPRALAMARDSNQSGKVMITFA